MKKKRNPLFANNGFSLEIIRYLFNVLMISESIDIGNKCDDC